MTFIDNIKSIPITDYAERCGYTLVKKGSRYVSLKEHDSVMIDTQKNAFWRNSVFQKGQRGGAGSVIDFAMQFRGLDQNAALRELALMYGIEGEKAATVMYKKPTYAPTSEKSKREVGDLNVPKKSENNNAVFRYLYHERKIDPSVIRYFLAKDMLYQDHHMNCVFASHRFACIRSTGGQRFVCDVEGCDYNECFFFRPSNVADTLIVAESVIDIMSIMTELVRKKERYTNYCYLALAGTNKLVSLFYHLAKDKRIDKVMLAFDNDAAGKKATETAKERLIDLGMNGRFKVFSAPIGKDWNEYIVLTDKEKLL